LPISALFHIRFQPHHSLRRRNYKRGGSLQLRHICYLFLRHHRQVISSLTGLSEDHLCQQAQAILSALPPQVAVGQFLHIVLYHFSLCKSAGVGSTSGSGTYDFGASATVTAGAATGYHFVVGQKEEQLSQQAQAIPSPLFKQKPFGELHY
jgi:hypothetical protein